MRITTTRLGQGNARLPASMLGSGIDSLGSPQFLHGLLAGLNEIGDFPYLFAGRARKGVWEFSPCVGYQRRSFENAAVRQLRVLDPEDPMAKMRGLLRSAEPGTVVIGEIAAQEITNRLRRELIFSQHQLSMRIATSLIDARRDRYFLYLYRGERSRPVSSAEQKWLNSAVPVALSMWRKHFELAPRERMRSHPGADDLLNKLTSREREVCVGLVRGRSLPDIAEKLDIGVTTARTYQQRAFARLGIRTRKQLFELLLPD